MKSISRKETFLYIYKALIKRGDNLLRKFFTKKQSVRRGNYLQVSSGKHFIKIFCIIFFLIVLVIGIFLWVTFHYIGGLSAARWDDSFEDLLSFDEALIITAHKVDATKKYGNILIRITLIDNPSSENVIELMEFCDTGFYGAFSNNSDEWTALKKNIDELTDSYRKDYITSSYYNYHVVAILLSEKNRDEILFVSQDGKENPSIKNRADIDIIQ